MKRIASILLIALAISITPINSIIPTQQVYASTQATKSKTTSTKTIKMYATQAVNIRKNPTTASKKIGTLKKNEAVKVTKKVKGWYKISKGGYVYSSYLTKQAPSSKKNSQYNTGNNLSDKALEEIYSMFDGGTFE